MKLQIGFLVLTSFLWLAPLASSQNAPETKSEENFDLPKDKTPEQILALAALHFGISETKHNSNDRAIRFFLEAKRLDPELTNARLYLATAYASKCVPGDIGASNVKTCDQSAQEFREVLEKEPDNLSAIEGLGSILFHSGCGTAGVTKCQESKVLFKKYTNLAPSDPDAHYWVGVIDWTLAYTANVQARAQYNASHTEKPLPNSEPIPEELRKKYAADFSAIIDDGIDEMKKAIALRADYDDAMAYLNLLYRRKADAAAKPEERDRLLKMADDLIDLVKEIKQKRAAQKP